MTQKLAILLSAKRPFNEMTVTQKIRLHANYQKNTQRNNSLTLQYFVKSGSYTGMSDLGSEYRYLRFWGPPCLKESYQMHSTEVTFL